MSGDMESGRILIGWATRDITPDRPVFVYGQLYPRISKHVEDPITATALALENETGDCAIMVSCDIVSPTNTLTAELRRRIAERIAGFPVEKIFVNAIHTHTAPIPCQDEDGVFDYSKCAGQEIPDDLMERDEYFELAISRISDAAASAWESRKAGGISWAMEYACVGQNRRATYANGTAQMYGQTADPIFDSPEAGEDHAVSMLFTWDENKKLTGIVPNVACPSQVVENEHFISADYWHDVRCMLKEKLGEVFLLPQCSAAGDISPHYMMYRHAEREMLRRRGLSQRQDSGRKVTNAIIAGKALAENDIQYELPFAHSVRNIQLPKLMLTAEDVKFAHKMAEGQNETFQAWCKRVERRFENQEHEPFLDMELHTLRLGEIAFCTNPFELFVNYGLQIKARSEAVLTFVVQLAAGRGTYLPTEKARQGGSYSAIPQSNVVGPEGGKVLVEETLSDIDKLFPVKRPKLNNRLAEIPPV